MTTQLAKTGPRSQAPASRRLDDTVAQAKRRRAHRPGRERSTVLTIALWVCAAYFFLPLLWLLISSTKSNGDLFSTFGFGFGKSFDLFKNIADVFTYQGGQYISWIGNTAFYAGVSALGAALLSTAAGYAFAKYDFPGSKVLFSVTLGAIMIPTTALAIPTYLLFASAGLTNNPLAVILPSLVSPFGVFLMRVYAAEAVPDGLIEAARIDGAGEFRIFWQVALRLVSPGVVTVFLFALVATWNNYFLPLIMFSNASLYPVTVGLTLWQSGSAAGGGAQALFSMVITGSLISIIPLIIAFLYLQRYWQTGLTTGGVKG